MTGDILADTLSRFVVLSKAQTERIASLKARRINLERRADVILEGAAIDYLPIVETGWLEQYRTFADGRRCVLKINLPGDIVDGAFPLLGRAQFSVAALTDARVALVPLRPLLDLIRSDAVIGFAFLSLEAYQHSFLRERVTTLACLSAYERLGHLCLELLTRLEAAGRAEDDEFVLPVSQPALGEVLGMHAVHVNRMFRRLEDDGFIARDGERIRVVDRPALVRLVEFRHVGMADWVQFNTVPDGPATASEG